MKAISPLKDRPYVESAVYVKELRKIANRNRGLLRAEDVVDAAREESSPLHKSFDWDDSDAAEKFRLIQARFLINRVYVRVVNSKIPKSHQMFVSLRSDRKGGGGYREVVEIMKNKSLRKEMIDSAIADMESFQSRYREIKELSSVFSKMEKAKDIIVK